MLGQNGNLPKQGWVMVGAWLEHKNEIPRAWLGQDWVMVGAWGMVKVRLVHGWDMSEESTLGARLGQGLGTLKA